MQPQEIAVHYEIPCRPWEVVGADIFMINGKKLLSTVDYHSKFPIVKKYNTLSADDLVQVAKPIFAEYGVSKKIVLDAGTNFIVEVFIAFCRRMNIQQTITSSYHYQSNGQMEACIKIVKCMIKNALTLIETFSFIAHMFNASRSRPPQPHNNAVQQADTGPIASSE